MKCCVLCWPLLQLTMLLLTFHTLKFLYSVASSLACTVRHRNQSVWAGRLLIGYFFKLGASGGDGVVEEAAAVTGVPGTAISSAVAGAAVAVGESSSRSKSRSRSRASQGHGWSQLLLSGFQVRPQLSSYLSLHSENCIFAVQRLPLSSSEVE